MAFCLVAGASFSAALQIATAFRLVKPFKYSFFGQILAQPCSSTLFNKYRDWGNVLLPLKCKPPKIIWLMFQVFLLQAFTGTYFRTLKPA